MAYGVTCSSMLLAAGYSPAAASASVHAAELVTSGISGHFHWRLGNVDRHLFRNLVWAGVAGGAIGAYVLASVPGDEIRLWVAVYLIIMGGRILRKAGRGAPAKMPAAPRVELLGFAGGFLDAIGGGGWGPIVTATLVEQGQEARLAIGSVNRAEFFVTLAESAVFALTLQLTHWKTIAALCVGGALAAPLAATVVRHVQPQALMIAVGLLIICLGLRTVLASW